MSMDHLKVSQIVEALRGRLECTQKVICSFIGITETSLSTSMDKSISQISENKVGKHLLDLLYVVETLAQDQSLTPIVIKRVLTTPYFREADDTYLDVVSAIKSDKFPIAHLMPIADAALEHLRQNYEKEKRPIFDGLYNQVVSERSKKSG